MVEVQVGRGPRCCYRPSTKGASEEGRGTGRPGTMHECPEFEVLRFAQASTWPRRRLRGTGGRHVSELRQADWLQDRIHDLRHDQDYQNKVRQVREDVANGFVGQVTSRADVERLAAET